MVGLGVFDTVGLGLAEVAVGVGVADVGATVVGACVVGVTVGVGSMGPSQPPTGG